MAKVKISKTERLCKFCGEPFIPSSNRQYYCKRPHYRICPVCGKQYLEDNVENLKRPPVACSYDCRKVLRTKTSLKRYGITAPGNNPEARKKSKQTMLQRYGVEYAQESAEIKEKSRNTWMKKYNVDNPMKDAAVQDKAKATVIAKYGMYPFNSEECYEKQHQTMMERYGVPYGSLTPQCISSHNVISNINRKFGKLLEANNIPYKFEFRLENYSYDIQILDTNILIEIDPTYTHNPIGNHWGDGLDKYYHRDKSQVAHDHGYRCIHVFDWDNWNKIVDIIKPKERIYARECDIWVLKKDFTDHFLNRYHIQGTCRGQLLSLGLIKDGECYQIMTFGKSRYDKSHKIELLRLCTRAGYQVIGGASKLFKYAVDVYDLYDIISYCDLSKFNGDVYEKLGMQFLRKTPPQEIWADGYKKITANLLRQRGYDQLFHTSYGKGTSNEELMLQNGWLPIYDCGQAVYLFS